MIYPPHSIAKAFADANLSATALAAFPGDIPDTITEAYAVQVEAIGLWPDTIGGWKVARIQPPFQERAKADRLIGPIFARGIAEASPSAPFPVIRGGAGAIEAEIILILAENAPIRPEGWSADAARALVGAAHIGIEIAGSAHALNNKLGPMAMICGYGNAMGLILGPAIDDWQTADLDAECVVTINGEMAGRKAIDLGSAFVALAFALEQTQALGLPLKSGQHISTGAITGTHPFAIGQNGTADFGRLGRLSCCAVAAMPFANILHPVSFRSPDLRSLR